MCGDPTRKLERYHRGAVVHAIHYNYPLKFEIIGGFPGGVIPDGTLDREWLVVQGCSCMRGHV